MEETEKGSRGLIGTGNWSRGGEPGVSNEQWNGPGVLKEQRRGASFLKGSRKG